MAWFEGGPDSGLALLTLSAERLRTPERALQGFLPEFPYPAKYCVISDARRAGRCGWPGAKDGPADAEPGLMLPWQQCGRTLIPQE